MNKAKFIFAALIMFAVIGGIFAFKANRYTAMWAWKTTLLRIYTFTTVTSGPIYTVFDIQICITFSSARFAPPGINAVVPTSGVPGPVTGTAPNGLTTSTLLSIKDCGPNVAVFLTDEF